MIAGLLLLGILVGAFGTLVGAGGGFVLAAECETPWDSKPENIRTMIETAEKYGQY